MKNVLDRIFGSRVRAKILGWFFTHIDEKFFVRQLAPILGEDPTNISREMAKLESIGILISARQGNQKQFQVNKECSFLEELRGLVLKTTGIAGHLKTELAKIKGVKLAFIYGSFAKGQETADSDVDLFIIGSINLDLLDTMLGEIERKLGRAINYVLYDFREFKEKVSSGDGFVTDVLASDKVMLMGEVSGFKAA
jgi:predicted nucleotidyltransferase